MKKGVVRVWNEERRGARVELKNAWCAGGMTKCLVRVWNEEMHFTRVE
jgi:hypothetical protein